MRGFLIAAIIGVLGACSPPPQQQAPASSAQRVQSPEAVVRSVYDAATARNAHQQPTDLTQLPLSDDLLRLVRQALEATQAGDEPFIDGDPVLDCQDCSPLSAITIATTAPPANGHATVEARFTVAGSARVETWDMVETPQGWRADNIRSADGYDLRKAAADSAPTDTRSCTETRGAAAAERLAAQCAQVSPATHPPCNAANSCAMMEEEIARSCALLTGSQRPAYCETH